MQLGEMGECRDTEKLPQIRFPAACVHGLTRFGNGNAGGETMGRKNRSKPIVTDPNGSYTGRAAEPLEKPVQDADDL